MDPAPWTGSDPVRLPFAVPRGRLASWVGGRMLLAVSQEEVADLLDVPPGSQVLEVGYGSGALLRVTPPGRPGADRLARRPDTTTPMVRRIALPYRTLSRIEQELSELFTGTERHELENMTAFTATR